MPALAEKGYVDVRVEVTASGGHSSVPPPHTAIGMLSAIIVAWRRFFSIAGPSNYQPRDRYGISGSKDTTHLTIVR